MRDPELSLRRVKLEGFEDTVLQDGSTDQLHVPAQPEPESPPSRRILVVDDNRDAARTLATLLEGGGHRVHVAFDGSEAIRAAEELELDVILLDIGLPELDGYEVARRIRAQSPRRDLLLFALTGWSQEEDRRRSKEAGFDAHLVKPLDIAEFARLVRSMTPDWLL